VRLGSVREARSPGRLGAYRQARPSRPARSTGAWSISAPERITDCRPYPGQDAMPALRGCDRSSRR
jgi:hypothetical protein